MKSEKLRIRGPRKTKVFWGIEENVRDVSPTIIGDARIKLKK